MEQLATVHVEWLEKRGLCPETATKLGVYSNRLAGLGQTIVVPIVREGQTINRQFRDVFDRDSGGKKFRMEPEAPMGFYNEDILRDETLRKNPLIITEGPMDMLAAIQSGYPKTVSVPHGAESNLGFVEDVLGRLLKESEVILAVDADDSGAKLGKRLLALIGVARCSFVNYPPDCKDLNDVVREHGGRGVCDVIDKARPYPVPGLYSLDSYPDVSTPKTFHTGWLGLDAHLRLWRGEFVVVTGIPGHGKSLLTLNMVINLCRIHRHKVAVASFEMPVKPYLRDIFRIHLRGQQSNGYDWREADSWISDKIKFIDPAPVGAVTGSDADPTLEWILDLAETAVIREGVHWLLLDPWNQIVHDMDRHGSAEYQRRAIMKIKQFARRLDCGVIVVVHPTKDVKLPNGKVRKPGLYDIDGSAHWYNAADHGIVIDRDLTSTKVEVDVKKSRFRSGGIPGTAWLNYNLKTGRYEDISAPNDYNNYEATP